MAAAKLCLFPIVSMAAVSMAAAKQFPIVSYVRDEGRYYWAQQVFCFLTQAHNIFF
jgi:hypothetical protein